MANKYENLNKIQAEFDFHNLGILSPQEIYRLADEFILNSQKNKLVSCLHPIIFSAIPFEGSYYYPY